MGREEAALEYHTGLPPGYYIATETDCHLILRYAQDDKGDVVLVW